ncbi:MAG TPA: HAMP domain-containing sensor histidine kinase [Candidatus Saccharimonadales bacterium]|jgi:two-component system sensor histidine kinase GlrK|nr:HAMP domain-containing sensor histidine kinase [Candidatus Saccharimonadales bacterium]
MKGIEGQSDNLQGGLLSGDLPFLVTAAHELKSPLSLVRQLALGLEAGNIDESEKERMLRQIVLTSERALRLTTDLSRSSRLEDSIFDLEPINPQQLCEDVAHELAPLYKARGRQIQVASHNRSMLVVANYDLLRRIMLNFGDNALHYTDSSEPVQLRARVHGAGKRIRLGVRDYGPAVPINTWQRLQESLGTNTQVLHNRPQSSGLGLYVAGQFANAMQGQIGATRHRDGATFYVDIDASTQLSLL